VDEASSAAASRKVVRTGSEGVAKARPKKGLLPPKMRKLLYKIVLSFLAAGFVALMAVAITLHLRDAKARPSMRW
jgi:hypothetical protein